MLARVPTPSSPVREIGKRERERVMYNMVIEFKRNDGCLGTF